MRDERRRVRLRTSLGALVSEGHDLQTALAGASADRPDVLDSAVETWGNKVYDELMNGAPQWVPFFIADPQRALSNLVVTSIAEANTAYHEDRVTHLNGRLVRLEHIADRI